MPQNVIVIQNDRRGVVKAVSEEKNVAAKEPAGKSYWGPKQNKKKQKEKTRPYAENRPTKKPNQHRATNKERRTKSGMRHGEWCLGGRGNVGEFPEHGGTR